MFFKKPVQSQTSPVVRVVYGPTVEEQEKKIKFLEKIVRIDIGLNLILAAFVVLVIISLLASRFSFTNLFGGKSPNLNLVQNVESMSGEVGPPESQLTADHGIYINDLGVDIDSAFAAAPESFRLTINGSLKKEVFGFLPYWAIPKIDEINIDLLTSISYFGLEVDAAGNVIRTDASGKTIDPWFQLQKNPKFSSFLRRVQRNKIKTYLTLKCFNQDNIVKLVTSPKASANFITNAVYLVNSRSLDGINIDFEYIGTPDPKVRDGFSLLMINLNKELKKQSPDSKLTIDTFIDAASNNRIHDIPVLAQNSDGLVIMGYDFHTPQSANAGPIAPFEGYGSSLLGLMSSYLEKAPPEKLILAVAYYGYDWPVLVKNVNSPVAGSRTDVRVYPYAEIAANVQTSQINWDSTAQSPWYSYVDSASKQLRIVHFENARSLGVKYDFINQKNLQGVGIWALGYDGKRTDLLQLLADKYAY